MIRVQQRIVLAVPLDDAWAWMADLERLVTADVLHRSVRFLTQRHSGVGTEMLVPHGLRFGPRMARRLRVTHWEPGRRIRWTDVDAIHWRRKHVFPHAEEFVLTPLDERTTLLTDTVTGSLNVRVPLLGRAAENLLETLVVRRVVAHQGQYLRAHIRSDTSGAVKCGQ